jgi:hypothetical protein
MNRIVIHIEGGIIQNIFSEEALPDDTEFYVVEEIDNNDGHPSIVTSGDGTERFCAKIEPVLSDLAVCELLPADSE